MRVAAPNGARPLAALPIGITGDARVGMATFFAAGARGLVKAQRALDEHGRERILAWEQEGLPPAVWTWARVRLRCPVAFASQPKVDAAGRTRLALSPRHAGQGSLTLGVRYIPTLHDAGDDPEEP